MPAGRNASAFADNFIRGFSFVDEIKRQKKADIRLEERLKEEKVERSFQKRRQQRADRRTDVLFEQQQEDRADQLSDEQKREEGDNLALNPDATDDELRSFAAFSPEAAAELKRRNAQARMRTALVNGQTIPQAGGGVVAPGAQGNQVTQGQSLSDAVAGQPQEGAAPATRTEGAASDFQFGRDVGLGGLQEVDIDEASQFDPEFRKKGFFGKLADRAAGLGSEIIRGTEDIVAGTYNAPGRIRGAITGENINPPTQNVGQEFGGNLQVPADRFTSTTEFKEMAAAGASQAEISAARNENIAVLDEYKAVGRRPQAMALDAYSRQGALLEGSDRQRQDAEQAQQKAAGRAQAFLDPTVDSPLDQMALKDPRAATVLYFQDRATLESSNPNLAQQMDERMLPIIDQAEADLKAEVLGLDPASPKGRQQAAALGNLQNSRNIVAKGQPSISTQAGINQSGLKVGDQPRVQAVADTIFDPNRPVPTQNTGAAINTAATVAGRISPNRRLNATQIDALATLAEAGYIDKPTAMSVMMTGTWPPGKNPNGIKKIQEAGENVYAITESGNVLMLQKGKTKVSAPIPTREIGKDQINWVGEGIRSQFPNMEDNNVNSLMNIMYKNPGWVRSRFNVTSQEDMRKLGAMLAESKIFAGKKFAQLDEGWLTNTKEAPTVEQIMMDPVMRDALANEFGMDYIPLPDLKDQSGVDNEAVRQSLREGRAGPTAAQNAQDYTDDQALEVYARWQYMQLDQAGRLDEDGNILPAPQGQ